MIGTIVGGVAGLGVGAFGSVSERDEELAQCMRGRHVSTLVSARIPQSMVFLTAYP